MHKLDNICSSSVYGLCVSFAPAGPKKSHFRVLFRQWLFLGPALQGRGASSPAQGQMTHTNHTPMNYKYCLVCACQGMASPLQSKLSPQISCATGLGVPIWYTLFKVSAQLVCSWLPNLCTNLKLRVHQLDNIVVHTVSFVFIDVELTTPEGVHWRKSTRKWLFLGPALQGRGASSPAQGQMTHTNHTPMNYKYCLVCACQGMASPLQSKLSPQISCATGLGVPIWYTLFKVSAQLVCSWLP